MHFTCRNMKSSRRPEHFLHSLALGCIMQAMTQSGETRQELLNLAQARGYEVSAPQLARWHRAGLLPRPEQRSLGKAHGTQTVYPSGTREQLLALCEVHAEERRLLYVAWRMWWAGYEVSVERIRAFIGRTVEQWDRHVQDLVDPDTGELTEAAWKLVDEAFTVRLEKPLSKVRKRVGRGRFDTFTRLMIETNLGLFRGFSTEDSNASEDDERRIMEKGLGLESARADRLEGAGQPLGINIENYLKEISWLADRNSLERELAKLTDGQLLEARDEVRPWLAIAAGYSLMFDEMLGRGTLGISAVDEAVRDMGAQEQGLLTLMWAISRYRGPKDLREGLEAVGKPTSEMETGLHDWEITLRFAEQLREEVPAFAEILAPQQIASSLDSRRMEHLMNQLHELAEQHKDEIKDFFKEHPEVLRELNESSPDGEDD